MTTRERLKKRTAVKTIEPVELHGGETVYVREMNAAERDAYEAQANDFNTAGRGLEKFRARLVVRTLCEKDGTRVYDDSPADLDECAAMGGRDVGAMFKRAAALNGLETDAKEKTAKNSEAGPGAGSR